MQTVAVICEKGGVGKTTLVLNLAVAAASAGESVVVLDIDTQPTATNWSDRRAAKDIVVIAAPASRLSQSVAAAKANGADMVIIDTAGKNEAAGIAAARLADLVLVPIEATPKAMETLPTTRDLLTAAGSPPAFVVLNKIHPQGGRAADDLKGLMQQHCGLPACPVHFTQRAIYNQADLTGQTPQEIEPNSRASAEAADLYLFVTKQARKAPNGTQQHREIA